MFTATFKKVLTKIDIFCIVLLILGPENILILVKWNWPRAIKRGGEVVILISIVIKVLIGS